MYPESLPARRWFEHYTTLFNTVEINNTFYRLPTEHAVEGWAAQAPPGFVYSLKLGSFGSHRMKLSDAGSWLPNHLDRLERLGSRRRADARAAPAPVAAKRRPPRRVPEHGPFGQPLGGRAARPVLAERRNLRSTAPPRRCAVRPRPAGRPPLGADHRLDLRPVPRAERRRATPTKAGMAETASSGWRNAYRPGWPKASTCTPTSTTTTPVTQSKTPAGPAARAVASPISELIPAGGRRRWRIPRRVWESRRCMSRRREGGGV